MAIRIEGKRVSIRFYKPDRSQGRVTATEDEILAALLTAKGATDGRDSDRPVLADFATEYIKTRQVLWKTSTKQQYEQVLKSQIIPHLGDRPINTVNFNPDAVLRWMTTLKQAGLGERRINLARMFLKKVLGAARGWLPDDPFRDVPMLKEPQVEIDPCSPEEVRAFLDACPAWWKPLFTVMFFTGIRPNEAAALKEGDVDWNGSRLRVRAGRYRGHEGTPKTATSVRDVEFLAPVNEALRIQRAQNASARVKAGAGVPEPGRDYLFIGPETGLLNANWTRDRVWYPALRKAGLRRRTMYQTRHSFASNALSAGEDPAWVARQLGHTTVEMLFTVYARWIPNRTRRDGSALTQRMLGQSAH